MIQYSYRAQNEEGKIIRGKIMANDEADLHERLKQDKKLLITAKAVEKTNKTKRLKSNVLSEFARNMNQLLAAGITIVKALHIITEDEALKPAVRAVYLNVLKCVTSGMPMSEALQEQGDAFPPLFINMIKSAEASGNLDRVAGQMADYYAKEYRLTSKIKSSMTYPKILIVMIVIVVAVIMGYVIPQFEALFAKMDALPTSTAILLAISNFVKNRWYVLIVLVFVGYIALHLLFSIENVRYAKDKMMLKLPKIGRLMQIIYTARFARTLASLYSSGISIVQCITISQTTIGNLYIERQFDQVIADIMAGETLSDSVEKVDGFTKKLTSSIRVSEETGTLDDMLTSMADQMEFDSEVALNKLVSYLEPVMIVIMALIVGFIMIAVIQAIYGSYQSISNSY